MTTGAPSLASLSLSRVQVEIKQFVRQPDAVFFTFLLPVFFVVIFGTVFSDEISGGPPGSEPVPFSQYFAAGMIAAGIMSVTFASLAISVAIEQHDGSLKRLAATPLPRSAYFAGKIGLALISSIFQVVVILTIGLAFYDMSLPTDPALYGLFAVVFLLGVSSCSLLGIAYTGFISSASSATAVVQPPYLVLMFISGVFFVYSSIPAWLQAIAAIFPLKWLVQGMRQVFLPDWVATEDYGGSWQTEWVIAVLAAWLVVSYLVARFTFRWDRSDG